MALPMRSFFTGLICPPDELKLLPSCQGKGWTVSFDKNGRSDSTIVGVEAVLHSSKWGTAQKALNLIVGCISLLSADLQLLSSRLIAWNDTEPEFSLSLSSSKRRALTTSNIPIACEIAAKASRHRKHVYAISKYQFSLSLFCTTPVDLDPMNIRSMPISALPDDHLLFAYSIIAAYSILEDLGLEIRSSQKYPSRFNGAWNPIVQQDLESRLGHAKINLAETLLWMRRGPRRRIERTKPVPVLEKADWARGLVRDAEIRLIDAIAHASWLRSGVASHKARTLIQSLSPYDVANVQSLARRLILETLGYWPSN